MSQSLRGTESLGRVETKQPLHQVQGLVILDLGEYILERLLGSIRQIFQKFQSALACYVPDIFRGGLARYLTNKLQLILHVFTWKHYLACEHLAHNASYGPHVDRVGVVMREHELWSAVPSRDNVIRLLSRIFRIEVSCQTEIANLEIAVGVDQDVGRFQITMQHFCRVQILHGTHHLVDEILALVIEQLLFPREQLGEIGIH
mmetsp:Transcript_12798/g.21944  ORF Transcript_12798/g.21944 Transcript_12798/m.21944 type:complete len:203 (-) Transcript_12798:1042-1650(-)